MTGTLPPDGAAPRIFLGSADTGLEPPAMDRATYPGEIVAAYQAEVWRAFPGT
jgi:hypothetical protein